MNVIGQRVSRVPWKPLLMLLSLTAMATMPQLAWAQEDGKATEAKPAEAKPAEAKPADAAAAPAAEGMATTADAPAADMATTAAAAPAAEPTIADIKKIVDAKSLALDTVWVLIAGFLVMWMQAGFSLVETGLTRAKNAVNICMKNLLDFCFGSIAFWAVGFAIMFGNGSDYFGKTGWFLSGADNSVQVALGEAAEYVGDYEALKWTTVPLEAKFFFQLVFAATAATIVSGAMAERTKFVSYMVYSIIISVVIYPVSGHWIWGGGWLMKAGFWDFAGSTVVHSLGGWIALMGALIIGARTGKFGPDGKPRAIPGHNLVLVTLGVFILWLGWFGFNPGSTMSALPVDIAHITVTTNMAAAVGAILALGTARLMFGKWEATMALNGALAGLVAVTCPCPWISMYGAAAIGAVAGVLVVLSVVGLERFLKLDDPVGAVSVHGVCGAWGTLSLGLFAITDGKDGLTPTAGLFYGGGLGQLKSQAIGVGSVFLWAAIAGAICFFAIKYTIGLRVSKEEEQEGLDVGEHGNEAYHGFQFVEGT